MLSQRVAELEVRGVRDPLIAQTQDLMVKGPDEVLADRWSDNLEWNQLMQLKLKWRSRAIAAAWTVYGSRRWSC